MVCQCDVHTTYAHDTIHTSRSIHRQTTAFSFQFDCYNPSVVCDLHTTYTQESALIMKTIRLWFDGDIMAMCSEMQTRSIYGSQVYISSIVRSMTTGKESVRSMGIWSSEICVDWLVVVGTGVCVEQSRGLYCEIGLIIRMMHAHEQTDNTSFQCSLHRSIHEGAYKKEF